MKNVFIRIPISCNVICFILRSIFISVFISIIFREAAFGYDHQKGAEKLGCLHCHFAPPTKPPGEKPSTITSIKSDSSQWCVSCHAFEAKSIHPIAIDASSTCGLPLESGQKIGCLTCHSPHQEATASEPWITSSLQMTATESNQTFLLISKNTSGELCRKCHSNLDSIKPGESLHLPRSFESRSFVGSTACQGCHPKIYDEWKKTPHARMTRRLGDVEAASGIPADQFERPIESIKFVLGSHFVHRFVAEATGTLVVLPKILDIQTGQWLPIKDYGWTKRFWLKQCAGCHSTGFSAENDRFVEAGVGCESCHGQGLNHVRTGSKDFIVNPARLSAERKEMVCESCHTSGVDNSGRFLFPIGFKPGDDLTTFYSGLTPKPGQDQSNFIGDESLADRHRQWDFLKNRLFLAKGLTCDYCQNFRNFQTASNSDYLTHDQYCLTCHFNKNQHPSNNPGTSCTTCHPPLTNASGTAFSIHDHKFSFQAPPPPDRNK